MLQDLIRPEQLREHDFEEVGGVPLGQTVRITPVARVLPQIRRRGAHLAFRVIVRTVLFLAVVNAVAGGDLVVFRMVLFLLPAVAIHAAVLQVAPIAVSAGLLLGAPESALLLG